MIEFFTTDTVCNKYELKLRVQLKDDYIIICFSSLSKKYGPYTQVLTQYSLYVMKVPFSVFEKVNMKSDMPTTYRIRDWCILNSSKRMRQE